MDGTFITSNSIGTGIMMIALYFQVLLTTSEALVFEGWVYTIDPVTHSWVLFTGETRGNFSIQLVMNSAVTTAKVLEDICPDNILDVMTQYGGSKKVGIAHVGCVIQSK